MLPGAISSHPLALSLAQVISSMERDTKRGGRRLGKASSSPDLAINSKDTEPFQALVSSFVD